MTKIKEQKIESAEVMPVQNAVQVQQSTPDSLIALAVEKNLDVDKLEKLLQLKEQWEAREAKKAFFRAMTLFQSEVGQIFKNREAYNYRYADLDQILEAIKPLKLKHGFSHRFTIENVKGESGEPEFKVTCYVQHDEGHVETCTMQGPADNTGSKNSIQANGSSFSYLQRYTLTGSFGITTAMGDDDGASSGKKAPKSNLKAPTAEQFKKILLRAKTETNILDEAQKAFSLTEDQVQSIKAVMPKES